MAHAHPLALGALASVTALSVSTAASAAHVDLYTVDLQPLSGSGVTGTVNLSLDRTAGTLQVDLFATGLTPNQPHPAHIHGLGADGPGGAGDPLTIGESLDSVSPTLADDADNDGFIEVIEGLPKYGNILLPLQLDGGLGDFAFADFEGTVDYSVTYDVNADGVLEDPLAPDLVITPENLFPLEFREIVIHGRFLEEGQGIDSGRAIEEADGTAGYKAVLPVAAGEIRAVDPTAVPTPAALPAGLALLGSAAGRRRRAV